MPPNTPFRGKQLAQTQKQLPPPLGKSGKRPCDTISTLTIKLKYQPMKERVKGHVWSTGLSRCNECKRKSNIMGTSTLNAINRTN